MMDRFVQLCLWTEESGLLAQALLQLFHRERMALIALKSDEVIEVTMEKEMAVAKARDLRKRLRESIRAWYGVDDEASLGKQLTVEQRPVWDAKVGEWQKLWDQVHREAVRNQEFLKHSQRNLGRLVENWRRLLGQNPLYSAQGKKVEPTSTGKVLQVKL